MNSRQLDIIKKNCSDVLTAGSNTIESLSELKGEHILITGGSGFMGSWLAELISTLNDDHNYNIKVTLVARDISVMKERSPHLLNRDDISFKEKSVCDLIDIPSDVSWIIHAAATPDNRVHSSNPLQVVDSIVNGTKQILDLSVRLPNLKKVVNISSGLIYGYGSAESSSSLTTVDESYRGGPDCTEASTQSYAEAKRMGESICSIYRTQFRLPIITLRPFAFIGPYQLIDRPWAINNFINDASKGGPIKIFGDHRTVRSYMYPSDMAFWILQALANGESGTTYNLGSSVGASLGEIADKVANCFPGKMIVSVPTINEKHRYSVFVPNIDKAKSELSVDLTVDIDRAIDDTVSWLQLES